MTFASTLRARGTAVPETALVVAIFLMLLYASVQYAVLGYEQVSADGATFVGAHDTVAEYGAPTITNNTYTQKVANAVFTGLRTAHVSSVANNGSYETDVSMGDAAGGFGGLLPTSLTSTSRDVEASTSSAAASPVGDCATGATSLASGLGASVSGPAVNLLQGTVAQSNGLFGLATSTSGIAGQTVVDLNQGTVTAHLATLQGVSTQLAATTAALKAISDTLNAAALGGLLNGVVGPATTLLVQQLKPLLAQALAGTLTQSSIDAATATLLGQSALLNPLGSALTLALYGNGSTAGLLSGPGGTGLLMQLNGAETTLNNLDKLAPAQCP